MAGDIGVQIERQINLVLDGIPIGAEKAAGAIGVQIRNELVKEVSRPGGGRLYKRGKKTHRASSPGDPPAVDYGRYRSSFTFNVSRISRSVAEVVIGTGMKLGVWLEFGTRWMAARPHFRPVMERIRPRITQIVVALILAEERKRVR